MTESEDDLARAVEELARTVEELRTELESTRSRRRPPFAPPTPGELLRFADDVAIPTLLTVLETSVRTLEAFQRGLDLVRADRAVRDRTGEVSDRTAERASAVRRTTLSQLDGALSQLQRAVSEGTLPADDRARDLLEDARTLRDDVDARLEAAADDLDAEASRSRSKTIEIDVAEGSPDDDPESNVDVDAELETLKDRYGQEDAGDGDGDTDEDDARPGGADAPDEPGDDEGDGR